MPFGEIWHLAGHESALYLLHLKNSNEKSFIETQHFQIYGHSHYLSL